MHCSRTARSHRVGATAPTFLKRSEERTQLMHSGRRHPNATRRAAMAIATAVGLACAAGAQLEKAGPAFVDFGNPNSLQLQSAFVDLTEAKQGFGAMASRAVANKAYVIHLDGPMTEVRRARLEAAGVSIGDYLPVNAFIVTINPEAVNPRAAQDLDFVRWYGEFQDTWKIAPDVGVREYASLERQTLAAQGKAAVVINLFSHATDAEVADAFASLEAMGAVITGRDTIGDNVVIMAELGMNRLENVAVLDSVQFIEDVPEVTLRNQNVRWVVQSNISGVNTLHDKGLRGEGQIVGVLDSKLNANHCAFVDTMNPIGPNHRKILAYNTSQGSSGHGSHVSGTVAGDDGGTGNNRGVAYLARIVFNDIPSFNETAVVNVLQQHHNQGARVHTNSWGNDGTTAYDSLARGFDVFSWNNEDSLSTLAVTNQSNLRNPENAKNLLACGATNPAPNQHNHCTGGVGPTIDGRRKPEVYAPGCSTQSANTSTCGTSSSSGTSMATPAIAGVALLARQYYMEGFYPGGFFNPGDGFTPTGALLKATVVNSAQDMTGVAGYPSNLEGWGRILADNTLHFQGDSRRLIVEDVRHSAGLTTGAVQELDFNVNGSGEQLRVTMAFMDAPGAAGSSNPVVNNLDLEVVSPTGQVYRGNVFSGGVSVTGGSFDAINNVEQVHITNPNPGQWTARVIGAAVNAVPSGEPGQGYALVITGDVQAGPASLSIFAAGVPELIAPGDTTDINVTINEGDDALVPGTPTMHLRTAGGSFATTPLTHVGGNTWQATLPAFGCDDEPDFYFSAEGVTTGLRTTPFGAPANFFSADVGTLEMVNVFYENFPTGSLSGGWTASGLWNITDQCGSGGCDGSFFAYYGQTSTCTYNSGAANTGDLTSPSITLPNVPAGGSITLTYCSRRESESLQTYDLSRLYIGTTIVDQPVGNNLTWETRTVDLTPYAGQTIQLRFNFDTRDNILNDFLGWQVDGINITAIAPACEDVDCPGDLNGDGVVDFDDLSEVLGSFGTTYSFEDLSEVLANFGATCN
ncbi:MAG: hypothetical protein EA379_02935 [Phycisphaerales bacterium]|nr:MAG: hypothetical protein EA379_02935 [Phycisphaerales bacterium]